MYIFHAIDFSQPLSCSMVPMGGRQRDKKCEYVFKLNTSNAGESEKKPTVYGLDIFISPSLFYYTYPYVPLHCCVYTCLSQ